MEERKKLIIDTDCGSDDAMAIAMALRDPGYEILCFTTVTGNVDARQAALNTLFTIEAAGTYEPPVYIGCELPLLVPFVGAAETHGQDGMGDMGLVPKRLKVAEGNGVLKIAELRIANPPTMCYLASGQDSTGTRARDAEWVSDPIAADMDRSGRDHG